jgi:hypothetical protein
MDLDVVDPVGEMLKEKLSECFLVGAPPFTPDK